MKRVLPLLIGLALFGADANLIQPEDMLAAWKSAKKPTILHVGFGALYRSKHVPGSLYVGPGNKPEGLALLKQTVAKLPRDGEIIIYCGCCPWDHCPNIQPAQAALRGMGFTNVKTVMIPANFAKSWIDKGYPVEGNSAK